MCPSWGEDTHQIDPVDIHPAQGPPAQISVVVFGVCIHTARVISGDTAEESNGKLGLSMGGRDCGAAARTSHKPPSHKPPHWTSPTWSCSTMAHRSGNSSCLLHDSTIQNVPWDFRGHSWPPVVTALRLCFYGRPSAPLAEQACGSVAHMGTEDEGVLTRSPA